MRHLVNRESESNRAKAGMLKTQARKFPKHAWLYIPSCIDDCINGRAFKHRDRTVLYKTSPL